MSEKWCDLVKDLMKEHGVSERGLCFAADVNRSTMRRFLSGRGGMTIDRLDKLLELFGYEIDFIRVSAPSPRLPLRTAKAGLKPKSKPKLQQKPEPKARLRLIRLACMGSR